MYTTDNKINIYKYKGCQLQREVEQLRNNHRDRRDKAREIDLAIESGIGLESRRDGSQTGREIFPQTDTTQIEDRLRDIVGRNAGDTAEDHQVHEHSEQRGYEIPPHTKDGLLKLHGDIALDKQPYKVFLLPKLTQA